jgi:hypothetical protein
VGVLGVSRACSVLTWQHLLTTRLGQHTTHAHTGAARVPQRLHWCVARVGRAGPLVRAQHQRVCGGPLPSAARQRGHGLGHAAHHQQAGQVCAFAMRVSPLLHTQLPHASRVTRCHRTRATLSLFSAIAQPLAARQAAHWELFGRPCCCNRCTLEQQLSPEAAAELQAVADKAQVCVCARGCR